MSEIISASGYSATFNVMGIELLLSDVEDSSMMYVYQLAFDGYEQRNARLNELNKGILHVDWEQYILPEFTQHLPRRD